MSTRENIRLIARASFNFLASLCSWWDWFESRFVGNPWERLSRQSPNYSLYFIAYLFKFMTNYDIQELKQGLEAMKLEYSLKIKCNDWLLADTWPQVANHCALFWVWEWTQVLLPQTKVSQLHRLIRALNVTNHWSLILWWSFFANSDFCHLPMYFANSLDPECQSWSEFKPFDQPYNVPEIFFFKS